jgi:hypothetical protein
MITDKPRASSREAAARTSSRSSRIAMRKIEMHKENRGIEHGSFSQLRGAARDCECDAVMIDRVRRRERIVIGSIDILHLTRELEAG